MTNRELLAYNQNRRICQVCLVTGRELESVLRQWVDILKVGPWTVLTLTDQNVQNPVIDGKRASHPFRYQVAVALYGNIQVEIIRPDYGLPELERFLREKGEGLQHFKEQVADGEQPAFLAEMASHGVGVTYSGGVMRDTFVNLDTKGALGFDLEIGNYADGEGNPLPPEMYYIFPRE